MTEKRIFTMASQVSSALVRNSQQSFYSANASVPGWFTDHDFWSFLSSEQEYLHSKSLIHGNIKARSVLVSRMFTAKLWGLNGVYARKTQGANYTEDPGSKKWQAPETLANRPASQKSDV